MRNDGKLAPGKSIKGIGMADVFRFMKFVKSVGVSDAPDSCWLWGGSQDAKGYGKFWFAGRMVGAHRFACAAFNKFDLRGKDAAHKCNNSWCVNPAHIGPDTRANNVAERNKRHGRKRNEGGGIRTDAPAPF